MNRYTVLRAYADPIHGACPVGRVIELEPERGAKLAKMGYVALSDEHVEKLVDLRWVDESLEIYNRLTGATLLRIPPTGLTSLSLDIVGNLTGNMTGNVIGDLTGNAATATQAERVAGATPVNAKEASLTTALAGDNNDMTYTAVATGPDGNSITVEYIDPGADGALSVAVTGTAIAVTLAYGGGGVTSKAADVKAAIDGTPAAAALVTVANAAGNTGAGLVAAMAATPLAGGVAGTVGAAGQVVYDGTYLYVAVAANGATGKNWRRIALGAAY